MAHPIPSFTPSPMRRIYTRIFLLLLYVVILGYVLYPRGASLGEGEGLRWLLVMGGSLLLVLVLFLLLRYREKKRESYDYGYYPKEEEKEEL